MSVLKNRELSSWKDVLTQLRRRETSWRGKPLSARDHRTWTEAVLLTGLVLEDLSNRYDGCGTLRDHVLWCHSAVHTDVDEVSHFLSAVISFLRNYSEDGSYSYSGFKHQMLEVSPNSGKLLAPMKDAITSFLSNPSPHTLYAPYQFFSFLTHLSLEDLAIDAQLEDEFLENEEYVRQHRSPDFLISRMREIMKEWFHDFKLESESFRPGHGPGSIAEHAGKATVVDKFGLVKPDQLMTVVFRMCAQINLYDFLPVENDGVTSRQASVVLVPKSIKTKRVISKEPATLMYFQQGVSKQIESHIRRHPELSKHINLRKQELQRELALSASRTKQFATVDLSAASDSVSYDLVKRVFKDTPLYPYLVALRSRTALLPSGKVIESAKYAPMGSALCFPIESLIFACISECTVRYVHHVTGHYYPVYRVYGDDIIIADPCLEDLSSNLRLAGFRLNEEKSFGGTARFRESCGCDAYDGVDVTPMKIGRRFVSRQVHIRSAGLFKGLIDLANSAYLYDFRLLRRYIIDVLINDTGWTPLFDIEGKRGLLSDEVSNHRLSQRWNDSYQSFEYRATEPETYQSVDRSVIWNGHQKRYVDSGVPLECTEQVRLWEWLRLSSLRKGDPLADDFLVQSKVGSIGNYLAKRWIVASKLPVGVRHGNMSPSDRFSMTSEDFLPDVFGCDKQP